MGVSQSSKRVRRPRWYWLYFVLAGFDLLTISFSLYLNHRLMTIYAESVRVNQEWAVRLGRYAEIDQLAAAVNAPGNDVFDSLDVDIESQRLGEALAAFRREVAAARAELLANVVPDLSAPLLKSFEEIGLAMGEMTAEAERIFVYFRGNQPREAGERMATMDRKYARLNKAFAELNRHVRDIQQRYFAEQQAAAIELRRFEYVIAACIAAMVLAVTLYGHKMAQAMASAEKEREHYLAALRKARNALEQRVAARTVELSRANVALIQEITERIQIQKALRKSEQRLRTFAASLDVAIEDERRRIARELHDELGQMFTGLTMDLAWLSSTLEETPADSHNPTVREKIRTMAELIDEAITVVRQIATDLNPPLLDNLGLGPAIEAQARQFQERTGIPCETTLDMGLKLHQAQATAVFRICQEAMTNVARHAAATQVKIGLGRHNGALVLEVGDNGRSITDAQAANPRSVGLTGMRERARLLGGTLAIRGEADAGTTVTLTVPL
jgi:signal transduction histidine kinase